MKTMILTTTLLAAAFGAAPAMAQRGPQGPVTLDAYLAMQKERFAGWDFDHDGVVTKTEMSSQMSARMGQTPPLDRINAMFAAIDTDGDGKATAVEAEAAERARFATLDTDHDGTLTPEERRAGFAAMRRQ